MRGRISTADYRIRAVFRARARYDRGMTIEGLGTLLFGAAVLHTLAAGRIHAYAVRFPEGGVARNTLLLLGEVEIVFGLWAGIAILTYALRENGRAAVHYLEGRNYAEPLFVFTILTLAATRPIEVAARRLLKEYSRALRLLLPISLAGAELFGILSLGALAGSVITEPAAMTIAALLLRERFYQHPPVSHRLKFAILATLLVNISIAEP